MGKETGDQISQWLKKLERESWQLELLVSAFTIFLLIQATGVFSAFLDGLPYQYALNGSIITFIYLFLGLGGLSIKALILFLIIHLLLRGFWIGAIGLRSVQTHIDFSVLNYSSFFTEKLKKKLVSLDQLVIILDEICSVIFSFSFLVISILFSFGLYLLFFGGTAFIIAGLAQFTSGWMLTIMSILSIVAIAGILITGIIYLIDYFTLGFLKKYNTLSKIYYPIYRFYGIITISSISRSIYYYMISKFSKRRIRTIYVFLMVIILSYWLVEYDQYQYYPDTEHELVFKTNFYEDMRAPDDYIKKVSIQSKIINEAYLQLFIRYHPDQNPDIKMNCPDFEPAKRNGINPSVSITFEGGNLSFDDNVYLKEDVGKLMECLSSIYEVYINQSLHENPKYYFFEHPAHKQQGIMTMIPTKSFLDGENILEVRKLSFDAKDSTSTKTDYAYIPFWFVKD